MSRRVAMIGVDAVDLDLVKSWLPSLPHFRRFVEDGTVHRLESTAGLLTGSVWPTFYTGAGPGEHGIYHHLQWDPESMRLRRVSRDWLDCEPFWRQLERRDLRVTVLDVPMTMGPRLERGLEVINWGSHDQLGRFTANSPDIAREVRRRFGEHPMGAEIPVDKGRRQMQQIRLNLIAGAQRKAELSRWLLGLRDWDCFLTVFGETHRGGHLLWPDEDDGKSPVPAGALRDVYRAVDAAIGRLLEALPLEQTAVVLFALHGMGPNTSQEHFVPRIMDRVNAGWVDPGGASRPQRSFWRRLRETVPAPLQNAIAQAVPVGVRDWVVERQISSGYDWSRTPAFPLLADLNGYIRFNLRGRERLGVLEAGGETYRRYLERLTACLRGLRAAGSGGPLVQEITLAGEAFSGRRAGRLPDLIVRWTPAPPAGEIDSEVLGRIEARRATGRGGNHRPDGFCAILGDAGATPGPRHIADLAAFVTRLLGRRGAP